jgi:chromosome segregation ATPase
MRKDERNAKRRDREYTSNKAAINARITDLENTTNTMDTKIDALSSDINSVSAKVDTKIDILSSKMDTIISTANQQQVTSVISTKIDQLTTAIMTIKAGLLGRRPPLLQKQPIRNLTPSLCLLITTHPQPTLRLQL